ncbi:hypothetical protein [Halorientalis sp.]|uniref:hypothetical protein n=1 Tax=Halorientalis sp. TaxID=1931229 RepID=UPI00260E6543|nr:hypothetical protein [Halorientalis sp.]
MHSDRPVEQSWPSRAALAAALGLYAGSVVVLWFVASTDRVAPVEAALVPAGAVVVGAAVVAVTVPDLAVVLARTRLHYTLFSVPAIVFLTHAWAAYVTVGPEPSVTMSSLALGATAGLLAVVVVTIDNRVLTDWMADGREPTVTWRARRSWRVTRRQLSLCALAVAPIVAGAFAGLLTADAVVLVVWTTLSGLLTAQFLADRTPRTFELYPDGLLIDPDDSPTTVPWSHLSGYSRTDDVLVLHRRLREPIRCSRGDIEELDTVVQALDCWLPRRDTTGRRP